MILIMKTFLPGREHMKGTCKCSRIQLEILKLMLMGISVHMCAMMKNAAKHSLIKVTISKSNDYKFRVLPKTLNDTWGASIYLQGRNLWKTIP